MAILYLKSENPNLSYIIKKNPATGLTARHLKRGSMFGYFSEGDAQTYNVYFKDAPNEISYPEYKDQEFEYINVTRYNSSHFILDALSEMFRDPTRKQVELDVGGFQHELVCNMVGLRSRRTLAAFIQHFQQECTIVAVEVAPKSYSVTFTTKKSLHYLLNLVNLFASFNLVRASEEGFFVGEEAIEKYLQCLTIIDPPYFIRYEFKLNLIYGANAFKKYRPLLEKSSKYAISMCHGDSTVMRMDAILPCLNYSGSIIDVGCGEGRYAFKIAPKLSRGSKYHAIDINPDCLDIVSHKSKLKQIDNILTYPSLEAFEMSDALGDSTTTYDVLMSEVIEHMDLSEATALVLRCLALPKLTSLVITTPNKDFNGNFFDDGENLRHPDHKFEFTAEEFLTWLQEFGGGLEYFPVGDTVDGISMTLGAVFRKREVTT